MVVREQGNGYTHVITANNWHTSYAEPGPALDTNKGGGMKGHVIQGKRSALENAKVTNMLTQQTSQRSTSRSMNRSRKHQVTSVYEGIWTVAYSDGGATCTRTM